MADDFQSVAADLVVGVLNSHPNTTTLMKAALVRQLANLKPEIVPWMEVSGSFATVANQAAYSAADTGFPKSLLRFERLGYDMGAYRRPLEVTDMETIRAVQEGASSAFPYLAAWYEEKLQLAPPPAGAYTIKWDAVLDCTKDTASGALLTVASTTQTNAWFLLPQVSVLKHLTWADYYLTSPDQRADLGQAHQSFASQALARAREAGTKREGLNAIAVTPNAFTRAVSGRQGSNRLSVLFPGAPV
jgi:hypothetical protein